MLRQLRQRHRPAIFFTSGILRQLRRAQMPQRHELAQIAVTLHIRRQQHQRHTLEAIIPSGGPRPGRGPQSRNLSLVLRPCHVQHHADNRLDARFPGRLIKRDRRIQTIRIRQRHGGHFLLRRRRNDFLRRRHAPQE